MKLAILSESPADEAAVAVLVAAALGRKFTRVQPSLRARGWPSVAQVLPSIISQPVAVSLLATFGAIVVSLALGIGFGVYPASRAARLTPIDALRSE